MSKSVLIFGATGKQGGAVITNLLAQNTTYEILAVTRNASSASAQKLAKKSSLIKLVQGDASDIPALFSSAKKASSSGQIWGVFGVQAVQGTTEETEGKAIVDAAVESGVSQFVYSSVDRHGDHSLENPTDVPHFITKHNIEKHLIARTQEPQSQMKYTILRPVAFMEILVPAFFGKVFATSFKSSLAGKKLQLIAVSDIGFFGAQALLNPQDWQNRALSLAGDEIDYETFAKVFKEKTGQEMPLTFTFLTTLLMWMSKEFGYMFRWFKEVGYAADVEQLRRMNPELKDFGTWLVKDSEFETK